jgi:CHAT domain-containing protein
MADIVGVEGRFLTTSDPAAAVERLSESIEFQRRGGRAFILPELYLERGRAEYARGGSEAALVDFDRGIALLERQRSRVRDYELRDGLFNNARDLFAEAVAASLDRRDPRGAFQYLERGRARALLEQLGEVASPESATIAAVQRSLGPGMVMLSYALLGDRVAIFAIDRGGLDVRFSDVPTDVVIRHAQELVEALPKGRDISTPAANLYDALLLPVGDLVSRATTLVIIPDGALAQLPFAALFDRRTNTYLVESCESLLAPSAAVFVACRNRAREVEASPPRSIALFANPTIAADVTLPLLPAADAEARRVARLYTTSLVLRRAAATVAQFRRVAARYDIVQFSGHARIDGAEPWKSALLLDVPLTARDIATMRFPHTRLAVLGACSTLAPNDDRLAGTTPMAASFLIAGVPAVVGTLWDVDDAEAAAVMVRLHEHISRGVPASTALRDVQREMLRASGRPHPAAWAAFTVLGADRR